MAYYQIDHELAARKDLSANDKLIFGVIKDHFRGNGRAYPGIRKLEEEAGLSRKTVIAAIRKLESAGLLIVDRGKSGSRTYYRFPESGGEPPPVEPQKAVENGQESGGELDKSGGVSAESGGEPPPKPPIEPPIEPLDEPKAPRRRAKPRAEDEPIPENLKGEIFETAWNEWLTYRRENKKAVTRAAAKKQLAMLAEAGVDDAIAMLDNSIKNDWQGVFPLRRDNASSTGRVLTDDDHTRPEGY